MRRARELLRKKFLMTGEKMTASGEFITVRVNVEITAASLQAIVEKAKKETGRDEKGLYRVDTADWTGKVISDVLKKYDFEAFAREYNGQNQT